MAAKLLHSLTDDNLDLHKQIGCMTGIFQLFDRQHVLTGGRRLVGHNPKRLPPGVSDFSNDTPERESSNAHLRSSSVEKYSHKNIQDKQRSSAESSRASLSSSSRSSSFSSLDCNRATQLEPASFDRITYPETPSKDRTMSVQNSSPQFSRHSRDLRDLVKDSMHREIRGLSIKTKTTEETADPVVKCKDSTRTNYEITDGSNGSGKQRMPADPLGVLAKLQEATWHCNEPRTLLRSSSYHAKDGSSFSISRDEPRFSYDGREGNRAPFDSRDVSKSTMKLKDLPRLSLESKAGSMRSLHADSKSNLLKSVLQDVGESEDKFRNLQQSPGHPPRPPSVVAKLMGLETLPNSVSSIDTKSGSTMSYPDKDFVNISRSFAESDPGSIQISSSSNNLRKEPSSPRWRNPDSPMRPMSRFPIEPAPWKQIDGRKNSQKPGSRTTIAPPKAETTYHSVYSEIDRRLKDLEFTESGKDLRALKQILEAMQSKGFLQTQKEVLGSNFTSHRGQEENHFSSKYEARSVDRLKPQTEQVLASAKRRTIAAKHSESPIVIMKPAKLVEKSGIPAAPLISLDGLSGVPKLHDNEFVDNKKGLSSGRTGKDLSSKSSQRDNAVNSANRRNERTLKTTQTSGPQQVAKDGNAGLGKSSGSISPRMQQKKLELETRSRPPTPPDSSKSRRQPNKQQSESNSPGGRRRPKHPNIQVYVESRNLNCREKENLVQSNATAATSEDFPGTSSCQSPSTKASEFVLSGLVEKNSTLASSEEKLSDFGIVPLEHSSHVSVLDNIVHKDDLPSPVMYTGKNIKVDVTMEKEMDSHAVLESPADVWIANSKESGFASEINRKKLQNIENLVQKLRRLNSNHDEANTDYIASLCENTDPDHRYISEILLASGLLLRDLGSSLASFQFHPSGHPINPELFLVLEQTKASSTLLEEECSPEKKTQLMVKEKFHRKLIFDAVNEILARKLASAGLMTEPWLRPLKLARETFNAQKLLRELCSEIEVLQAKNPKCSSNEEDDRWKNILYKDVMHQESESWTNFDDEISGAVLDIERSIFKDLVDEIVIGDSADLKTKSTGIKIGFV